MAITTTKNELFTSGPISFSSLQSNLGGSQNNIKFSTYIRNTDPDEPNPIVPDATENENISAYSENLRVSDFRNMINRYEITQTGNDANLNLSEIKNINEQTGQVIEYVGPWNGNLHRNVLKKISVTGNCYATTPGRFGAEIFSDISNLDFEVTDTGAIYGAGGQPGNAGSAPQTAVRTTSLYHEFNNASDQTLSNEATGGIKVEVINPNGPDGLKLNGDVTTSTALYKAKHYRVIFENAYLDTNYTILVSAVSEYTAGGGYGKNVVEGIGDKQTDGFRIWFKRTVAPGGGVNANTYVRSFLIQTEGNSSASITPVTFSLSSTDFLDGDNIPLKHYLPSAGGANHTPQLSWSLSGLPDGVSVSSYDVYLEDLSTPNSFRHWDLENISASVTSITSGQTSLPLLASIVPNDYGKALSNKIGYDGPNPPSGERHHYRLTVRASLSGSPSKPVAKLDFYAGTGTLIPDKNPPTHPEKGSIVVGAGVNELGEIGGPGGDGGGALYINNLSTSGSENSKIRIKLNDNAKIWGGGGGGGGGKPGKNGPAITCYSTFTFTTSPSNGNSGGTRTCPGNDNCPYGSSIGCNPNDVRSRCRGSSPRRGESGYVCAGNWTRTCQYTSSNLTQGLGGSGGSGGVGRGYANINVALTGSIGSAPNTNSCSGATSSGTEGTPGGTGGEWGESGEKGGSIAGKAGPSMIISKQKYYLRGDNTRNIKGPIRNI